MFPKKHKECLIYNMEAVTVYLTVDKSGQEIIHNDQPIRNGDEWITPNVWDSSITLPKGTIKRILGFSLDWDDEPFKISGPIL